jgi:hypothetical protein
MRFRFTTMNSNEQFIATSQRNSVSHFIDCISVARRLCASLLRQAMQRMKRERSKT